ncbi:MAG: PorV/PorQ family protein [bacterium]|nr:PorV/PorQ family protein [bacterium]
MKFFSFILIYGMMLASVLSAGEPGTKSMTFLNIAPNARVAGLGESFTALADDVSAIYWNPAGLSILKNMEVGLNYNMYFDDMSYLNLQFSRSFRFGSIGLNISSFNYGGIDNYVNGSLAGTIDSSDLMVMLGYSASLLNDLYFGINFKYVLEKLTSEYSGTALAGDIGLLYVNPLGTLVKQSYIKPLNFGIMVQNIGVGPKFEKEANSLPLNIRFGFSYKLRFAYAVAKLKDINFLLDFIAPSDSGFGIRYGTELWWYNLASGLDAALRLGLKAPQDLGFTSGLTVGVGLRIISLEIDYSFVNFGDLGLTHRMGLDYKFGKIEKPKEFKTKGKEETEEFIEEEVNENPKVQKEKTKTEPLKKKEEKPVKKETKPVEEDDLEFEE